MPSFPWSRAMTANQLGDNPLTTWQLERIPIVWGKAYVTILQRATTTGVRQSIFAGTTNILQRAVVQAGGTAGTTPAPLNTPVTDFLAYGDDVLQILNDEVSGGTPTVDGVITVEPAA